MQTTLDKQFKQTRQGKEADDILRKCVHCGFCNATCPTYQLLGDELDGPRGRIYLMKQALEGGELSSKTQQHLDRCLQCRACETTCPSGVEYHRLFEISKSWIEKRTSRGVLDKFMRKVLTQTLPYPKRFAALMKGGQWLKPFLPQSMRRSLSVKKPAVKVLATSQERKMLVLEGCVQPSLAPNINHSAKMLLSGLGIELISAQNAGCCGALDWHMSEEQQGLSLMKKNIDAWWPYVENGLEAIVMTASGCGSFVKEYAYYLSDDADYAHKAEKISQLTRDISEVLYREDLTSIRKSQAIHRVAYHAPCSLQHGQKLTGVVEKILLNAGYTLTLVEDPHICCGSAGSYSILQKSIATRLQKNKLENLQNDAPDAIVTMNIGCHMHLASDAKVPVMHLVELLAGEA